MNLWIIFLTGLTTGGLSCAAVQGGLLTSIITNQKKKELQTDKVSRSSSEPAHTDWLPVSLFMVAKLVSHTLVGALLGTLGSVMTLSLEARLLFQALSATFMVATAMNLLSVHPIFRFVAFQPPAFIRRRVRLLSKNDHLFAPVVLGLFSVVIPCGVTQAMEVLAINSGSPILGASIMLAFVLGTAPIFGLLGIATAKLSTLFSILFLRVAATALVLLALISINGVFEVLDFPVSFSKIQREINLFISPPQRSSSANLILPQIVDGKQRIKIKITSTGYSPTKITVIRGVPVELELVSTKAYSCAVEFTLKEFGIYESLGSNDKRLVTFTPTETGKFSFSCSMGMYTGVIEVIE